MFIESIMCQTLLDLLNDKLRRNGVSCGKVKQKISPNIKHKVGKLLH